MRVLITGIDGFVGSHMVDYLLALKGVEVCGTTITRDPGVNLRATASQLRLVQADIRETHEVEQAFSHLLPDRVIHLAAQPFVPASLEDPAGTLRTNLSGTLSVLEAVRTLRDAGRGNPSLIVVSSSEVYGSAGAGGVAMGEETLLAPANPYAASKAGADLVAQAYRTAYELDVTVVRPFNHAGPRQNPSFVCSSVGRQLAEISLGIRPPLLVVGNTEARRDFTDVRDVVRAYWTLFGRTGEHSVFNVCSGEAHAIGEIIALYQDIAGLAVEVVVDPARLRHRDAPLLVGSYTRLHSATGWRPTVSFTDTLRDVFQYWRTTLTAAV